MKEDKEADPVCEASNRRITTKRPATNFSMAMKRMFKMSWSQRGLDIYIIFMRTSDQLDFNQFDVALTDRSCSITAPGMEKYGWNFFLEVMAKDAQIIKNDDRMVVVIPKKDPTLFWPDLKRQVTIFDNRPTDVTDEPPPEKIPHQSSELNPDTEIEEMTDNQELNSIESSEEVEPSNISEPSGSPSEESLDKAKRNSVPSYQLSTVDHEWHEVGSDVVVLTVKVTNLDPWYTNVSFAEDRLQMSFKTADEKFHTLHGKQSDTLYGWNIKLHKKIVPTKCSHSVSLKMLEIQLVKKVAEKWSSLLLVSSAGLKEPEECSSDDRLSSGDNGSSEDAAMSSTAPTRVASINSDLVNETVEGAFSKAATSLSGASSTKPGYTGLENIGNTCFINSVLQALANTAELRQYFLGNHYKDDINTSNPLGMNGRMAEEFSTIMTRLWCGTPYSFAPLKFVRTVGACESRFIDHMQHDAQEFMAFLLDKLHEDLNRIKDKPYFEIPEDGGREDHVVAEESWKLHTSRNDSYIVDLFHGMFKSRLFCPECEKSSAKFDPFLFLPVPLPKATKIMHVFFIPRNNDDLPIKIQVRVSKNCGIADEVLSQVSKKTNVPVNSLRMFEVFRNRVHRFFVSASSIDKILSTDVIFVQETLSAEEAEEPVFEIAVLQRRTFPEISSSCCYCKNAPAHVKIKRCTKCLRTGYCNQECQKADWPRHRKVCERVFDLVGYPFIASIPRSHATYQKIKQILWRQAVKWTDVSCFHSDDTADHPATDNLFHVSAVSWSGVYKPELPALDEFDDNELLDLSQYKLVAMDWETDTRLTSYVKVTSKQLEWIESDDAPSAASISLYDCIQLFTQPEVLAPQEAWYCPNCKDHREATKQMSLWKLPDVLMVQLKRFSFKNYLWRDKLDMFVDFPVNNLDMSSYCINNSKDDSLIYDLFAVVNHHGGIFGGHYTSYVRLPDITDSTQTSVGWRICDDSHVMKTSSEHVVTKAAYVMFYKRRQRSCSVSTSTPSQVLNNPVEAAAPSNRNSSDVSEPRATSSGNDCMSEQCTSKDARNIESKLNHSATIFKSALSVDTEASDESLTNLNRKLSCEERASGCICALSSTMKCTCDENDCQYNPNLTMDCMVQQPLLKYDEIFGVSDDELDVDDVTTGTAQDKSPQEETSSLDSLGKALNIEPISSYTDMDAID